MLLALEQHIFVFQAVNLVFLQTAHIDLLAPGIIGMGADAVDCDDTRIKLLAPVTRLFKKDAGIVLTDGAEPASNAPGRGS